MKAKLRRNERVRMFDMGDNSFEIRSKQDDVLMDSSDDYFIYMTGVNFIGGNIIEGRYMGVLDDNSPIIDNSCKDVVSDGNKFYMDGKQVRTARMVAVNNKTKVIVIITK